MTTVQAPTGAALNTAWKTAPTQTIHAGGGQFAYRQLGPSTGVPVVFLTHLAAVLDNWDPRIVDGIAGRHRVITFDNRGVGASSGSTPTTIEQMASDAVTFIRALGFDQVDLFGFSMGGMIAQVIAQHEPRLVRKMILAGTGPAGGEGIDKVTRISYLDTARGLLTRRDPKEFLFFTRTPNGRRAGEGVPGTARGTYQRPRQGHLRRLIPRPAQGHPPMGSAAARGPREHPPAGARHERRERQDGAHQEHRRPRSTTPEQPARHLSRRRARRRVPVPRGLRQAGSRVPMKAFVVEHYGKDGSAPPTYPSPRSATVTCWSR